MKILLCNDDGIHSGGLLALSKAASNFGEIAVVAPHINRSAVGRSLSIHEPLRIHSHSDNRHSVNGTPADCVCLAIHHILKHPPDLLLSGINEGPNLGSDVMYSGTVGAAMEGTKHHIPSLAFSFAKHSPKSSDWEAIIPIVKNLLQWFLELPTWPAGRLLNINIPIPKLNRKHMPMRITRLGEIRYPEFVQMRNDPRGQDYFWLGRHPPIDNVEYDDDTDCKTLQEGSISITPLHMNLSDFDLQKSLQNHIQR